MRLRPRRRPIWPGYATAVEAICYLASACDGAVRRDGHGFGTDDVEWGHFLARTPGHAWTRVDRGQALRLIRIYQRQLRAAGFDPQDILDGVKPKRRSRRRLAKLDAGWRPDATGVWTWRYFNGVRWTEVVADQHGQRHVPHVEKRG